jgi:anaerobic sulfite reductase subunit B
MPGANHAARVERAWAETKMLHGLSLVAEEVSRRHDWPGQYLRVRLGGAEKPYALASEPGAPALEFLFKTDTELTQAMAKLAPGDAVLVGLPQGTGFPVRDHEGQDLILCAAGTGIAPLRAVVRTVMPVRARFGRILLFYGQRAQSHFAYAGEHAAWRAAGVELHLVASEAGKRLQEAVRARHPDTRQACAYLCGMKPMVADVARILGELGLPRDRVFVNV